MSIRLPEQRARTLRLPWASLSLLALAFSAPARADVLADRHSADAEDLLAVERQHPSALALFRDAERLLSENKPGLAAPKLELAKTEAPNSAVLARRLCQTLTVLGKRSSAIQACGEAMVRGQTPMTLRATVGALMSEQPTPEELAMALRLTTRAKKDSPNQPWGYAAECDIARRLGDRAMYKRCLENLETIAPGHYETLRALELGGFAETPRWVVLLWLTLLAGVIATLAHAVGRALGRGRSVAVASAGCLLLLAGQASAQESPAAGEAKMLDETEKSLAAPGGLSKWKIDSSNPLKSVPTPEQRDSDPLNFGYHLMDLADLAQQATEQGNFAQASKYWEATVLGVPEAAVGYRKTCIMAELAKDMNRAYRYCRAALGREGAELADYRHFAAILTAKPSALEREELTDLQEIAKHVRGVPGGASLADELDCEYGLRTSDLKKLDECVIKLVKSAPNDPRTITYQWASALGHERFDEARGLIARASATAMKREGIVHMERATAEQSSLLKRLQKRSKLLVGVGIGALVLGLIFMLTRLGAKRRSKTPLIAPVQTA